MADPGTNNEHLHWMMEAMDMVTTSTLLSAAWLSHCTGRRGPGGHRSARGLRVRKGRQNHRTRT